VAAPGEPHRLAARGSVERFGDWCSPVHNERVAILVEHGDPADAIVLAVGAVDAAEDERLVTDVQVVKAGANLVCQHVAFEASLVRAPSLGFDVAGDGLSRFARPIQARVGMRDVRGLVCVVRMFAVAHCLPICRYRNRDEPATASPKRGTPSYWASHKIGCDWLPCGLVLPLICIDVDGTLVGSLHRPTEAVWAAADKAVARGQHLALSTARGAFGPTLDYARRLDPSGWHIFHNGGALVHTGTGEVRGSAVSDDVVLAAEEIAMRNGWIIEYYTADDYSVDSDDDRAVEHSALCGVPHRVRTRDVLVGDIVRVQFVVPSEVRDWVMSEMRDQDAVVVGATSPVMPGTTFVSCTKPGVSKGAAIKRIAAEMGITTDDVMMVGDGDNDVEAIGSVRHGVAMANAVPAAKDAAAYEVGHVDDDGLIEALELSTQL